MTAIEVRGGGRRRVALETPNITPICEEEEEDMTPSEVGPTFSEVRPTPDKMTFRDIQLEFVPSPIRGLVQERGDSLMEGYFDSSISTIEEEEEAKENDEVVPGVVTPSNKRRSQSPGAQSPSKRIMSDAKYSSPFPHIKKNSPRSISPIKKNSPRSISPLNCLKGSGSVRRKTSNEAARKTSNEAARKTATSESSPGDTDLKPSPITVRPKPKFQVINGKLVPI